MAITVVILWLGTLVVAVLLLRARLADRASAWAVRSGIVLARAGAAVGFLIYVACARSDGAAPPTWSVRTAWACRTVGP